MRPHDALVAGVRAEVANLLAARRKEDEDAGQRPLSFTDERVIAVHLTTTALERRATDAAAAGDPLLTVNEEDALVDAVINELFGLGGFQQYLDDPDVENINANGADNVWITYADGSTQRGDPVAASDADLVKLLQTAASRLGVSERRFDRASPHLNLHLADSDSRLSAVMSVTPRPCVSIRRHRHLDATLDELHQAGMLDAELQDFVTAAIRARKNIMVAGATGAGKTTMLRACARALPYNERLVTIEDSRELVLERWLSNVVPLEAREPNVEGEGTVTQSDLVRWALRLDPSRVIVGEVRGAEVIPMLNAMSQGNDGSLSTIHANSSAGVFAKLATYAIQAPERLPLEATNLLVANALHLVIFLARDRDGRRVVTSVREVVGADGRMVVTNEVFRPGPDGLAVPADPLRAETLGELMTEGYEPSPSAHLAGRRP